MVIKIYALMWLLVAASAGLAYFTASISEMTLTVFGLIASTLFAIGIVAVLPWWVDRKYTWRYEAPQI